MAAPAGSTSGFLGTAGGYLYSAGSGFAYQYVVASIRTIAFQAGDTVYLSGANPLGAGIDALDLIVANGYIIATALTSATTLTLFFLSRAGAALTVAGSVVLTTAIVTSQISYAKVAAAAVGNKLYVATAFQHIAAGPVTISKIRVTDITLNLTGAIFTDFTLPGSPNLTVQQMGFQSDNLLLSVSDNQSSSILSYNVPASSVVTLAVLQGVSNALFTTVGGGIFILAAAPAGAGAGPYAVDMYLLTTSQLQHIGPLNTATAPFFDAVSRPFTFGPYAVWMVSNGAAGAVTPLLYAYDVIRGRLFKPAQLGPYATVLQGVGFPIAVPNATLRTINNPVRCSWGVVIPLFTMTGGVSAVQEVYFGVVPQAGGIFTSQNLLSTGISITSSLIDFTSASNKLYRQVLVSHEAILAGMSVTVNAWLDQDPSNLAAAPDFTVTHAFNALDLFPKQTALVINKLARKLVYQVITSAPAYNAGPANWTPSPKPQSVAIQVATGWVQTLTVDLSPTVLTNSKTPQDYVFQKQGFDHVAAYQWLRAIWRLRGGQVIATFPNGDTGPWLMQDFHVDSPKPMAASFRADQKTTYQVVVTAKLREDL